MADPKSTSENADDERTDERRPIQCAWFQDPACGLNYWTNRQTELCMACEKMQVPPLESQAA